MQQSNLYVIGYALVLTTILGGGLAALSLALGPEQDRQVELDRKKQILSAVMNTSEYTKPELAQIYEERINSFVVNAAGDKVEGKKADEVDIRKQYKNAPPEERLLPVFKYKLEDGSEAYILPMYGKGLWDLIWGYVAVDANFESIIGVSFDHQAETPGLGARITDAEIQNRYKDKKIAGETGNFVPVVMVKGENNKGLSKHEVDGMSGATITAKGVNDMLKSYLLLYKEYFKESSNS